MNAEIGKARSVSEISDTIRGYIVENILFGEDRMLESNTSLHESGVLDSTGILEVITFLEQEFGIEIADDEVVPGNLATLRQMSSFVRKKLDAKTSADSSV